MALEKLKDWDYLKSQIYIEVNYYDNLISFKIQSGPINEVNVDGVQITDLILVAKKLIEELNKDFSCRENSITITKLDEALMWQEKRTKDRLCRGVEGKSLP